MSHLNQIFDDEQLVTKIKQRLPHLFQLAELDASRAGKLGMEIGSVRERVLIALLMHKFGEENVETEIPITESEVDVKLFGEPVSIKTITTTGTSGVKVVWTVDAQRAKAFRETYVPSCDILLVRINWGGIGGLFFIPLHVQQAIFGSIGRNNYLKLPTPNTNPRGVEFASDAMSRLLTHTNTRSIEINWNRQTVRYNPYQRWVDYWREN
ncbi:MAG: ThaI family type II restriction endonuclease [Nitrososphaerales archaeon]